MRPRTRLDGVVRKRVRVRRIVSISGEVAVVPVQTLVRADPSEAASILEDGGTEFWERPRSAGMRSKTGVYPEAVPAPRIWRSRRLTAIMGKGENPEPDCRSVRLDDRIALNGDSLELRAKYGGAEPQIADRFERTFRTFE